MPEFYDLTCDLYPKGIKVHHSRIVRFIGQQLPYFEQLAENYWGASEITGMWTNITDEDIEKADDTIQEMTSTVLIKELPAPQTLEIA